MTPTTVLELATAGLLAIFAAGFFVLIGWMLWETTVQPIWLYLLYHWRAWRGRDDDDHWHA